MDGMRMTPSTARAFWKALMDNATGLVADADALLERESFGRARSLTVLAQEELSKALWIYETFEGSWSTGAEAPMEVAKLKTHGRHLASKYMEAFVFGQELAAFWATTTPSSLQRRTHRRTGKPSLPRGRASPRLQVSAPTTRRWRAST
jgi:AbiV family abortive infection protein